MNKEKGNAMNNPNHKQFAENDAAQPGYLAKRPERHNRHSSAALLFILCGCLVILGGAGILAWQFVWPTNVSTPPTAGSTSSSLPAKQSAGCTGAREPANIIQQQTAQGLHLTVAQVQMHVLAGKTIAQIATEQGLTSTQLHSVEVQALQTANSRWLSMGCITQQDVRENMQRDVGSAAFMNTEFTDQFKH